MAAPALKASPPLRIPVLYVYVLDDSLCSGSAQIWLLSSHVFLGPPPGLRLAGLCSGVGLSW